MPDNNPIRQARSAAGLTAAELAERLGVTVTTVSRLENGHHAPSDVTAAALAEILGGSPEDYRTEPARRPGPRRGEKK